ncbi:unnamed protein product [Closterium sp. NIES-65]|nr:unnamed protein product [Closterium sp. NIES-65]
MPMRGFVGPQYSNVGFRYGYIGVQPNPTVHAPASVVTPPVAASTPFPSAIHPESQPAVQAPPDPREALGVGLDTRARTDGPSSNAVAGGLGHAVNGGAGMNASVRAHSPPIWNVNSLLPENPDVHIRTPTHPIVAYATGVGGQPQANAGNAGRGAGASGNAVRGRGTGARGNAGGGTGERGNADRGRGAIRRGGRASAGRATGVGANKNSANGQGAHGVTGSGGRGSGVNANGGSGNGPVNRPRIRRRRVDVVPHTARNGSWEGSEGTSDEDDEDGADDADDSWNDDDENYLSNSLSALNEEEAEDNERVRGTRRDIEVPIADWNRLGVDDTPAAKREMCYGILYGVSEATLKKYRGWANEYKQFVAHELPKLGTGRFGDEAALRNANPDEIGVALEQNMGGDWKMAEGDEQWFHGPGTNPWRLRKYVTFLANETVAQADRMATLKRPQKTLKKRRKCTPAMLMGRLKALNLLIKLDGAIFRKPVLNLLRDFAECRIWVRVQVRDQYKRFIATGKTNKDFSLNYISSVRHIDWTLCAVGATLLWLHWVYDLVPILYEDIAPPLDFTEPSTWAGGAQHASADGMPSDQLARLGGWRFIDVMTKHYLTTIPREAVLLMAGFTGVDGDYFLGRATVPVNDKLDELLRKHIFPWAATDKGQQQCKDYNRRMVETQKPEKQDTAGLNILKELDGDTRMAVAQDLAMYYIHQPRHPYVVNNPLCQTEEFASWAADVSLANQLAIVQRNTPTLTQPAEVSTRMDAQNQVTVLTEYLTRSQADNTRLGLELVATHKRVKELEGLLEDRDRKLAEKDERVNDLEAQLSRLTVSSSGPTAVPNQATTPGAAAASTNASGPTEQETRKKPAAPTREQTIRDAIVLPWVNATKPSDGWKLYKTTHPLILESPESLLAQPRGAVSRMAALIGEEGGGQNAINRVKRIMNFIAHRVEQGDDIAVVLDKLDLMSGAVGMSGVSEGIAVKKKSVDMELSQLKKGSPVEVQLRVKWMLVRDRLINASLPASEFTVAWPQYCALMPDLQ